MTDFSQTHRMESVHGDVPNLDVRCANCGISGSEQRSTRCTAAGDEVRRVLRKRLKHADRLMELVADQAEERQSEDMTSAIAAIDRATQALTAVLGSLAVARHYACIAQNNQEFESN